MSFWDDRYADDGFAYGDAPNDFLAAHASRIPNGAVLCLAEGEGRNAVFLAGLGYDVLAVDQSEVGLRKAERLAASHGVSIRTQVADLADFPIASGAWQGIVSVWCHVPPPLRRTLHAAVVQGLAPGGVLVLEAYHPRQLEAPGAGGPPVAGPMMTPEGLREELAGLSFAHLEVVERVVNEGRYHQGLSVVTQAVAVKPG